MYLILGVVLFIAWIAGFILFKTAGVFIHILLIFALISVVMHFVAGRKA